MRLTDNFKVVLAAPPALLATTAGDGDYVSLKNFNRLAIIIAVDNATTVTGGVVTLKQATDVAGTDEKALAFTSVEANIDTGAGDTLTETAVTSNTFTTSTVDNKNLLYVINVKAEDLDRDNGFDCVRVDVASSVGSVGSVVYVLGDARYTGAGAIVD